MSRALSSLVLVALLLTAACGSSGPDTRTQITRSVGGEGFAVTLDHAAEGTNPIEIPLADEPLEPVFFERVLPSATSDPSGSTSTTTSVTGSGAASTSSSSTTSTALSSSTTTTAAPTTTSPPTEDEIYDIVSRAVAGYYAATSLCESPNKLARCPAVAIGVVVPSEDGEAPVTYTFGFGDAVLPDQPLSAATQFELGGQSQIFTAVRLAQLLGPVDLDDSLSSWLPDGVELPDGGERITIGDLATHRSGLPDLPPNLFDSCPVGDDGAHVQCPAARANYTVDMLWEALSTASLAFSPGNDWLHSDFGYALLGQILAVAFPPDETPATTIATSTTSTSTSTTTSTSSSTTLPTSAVALPSTTTTTIVTRDDPPPSPWNAAAVRDAVGPIELTGTVLENEATGVATPYFGGGGQAPAWNDTGAMAPAGGLVSTIPDMTRLVALALGYESNASAVALENTLEEAAPGRMDPSFEMGLGWQLYTDGSGWGFPRGYAYECGATFGMRSATALVTEEGYGVTVLSNAESPADDLALRLLQFIDPVVESRAESATTTTED
jgi:D-alanyl-D-alanine-carboxypeptidase/D-alanyl-D-alanine-endopeptidase